MMVNGDSCYQEYDVVVCDSLLEEDFMERAMAQIMEDEEKDEGEDEEQEMEHDSSGCSMRVASA